MARHIIRVVTALLVITGPIAIDAAPSTAGVLPRPKLSAIEAIFVPPDTTQPITKQCSGAETLVDPQSVWTAVHRVSRCTTYYDVDVPLSIGQHITVRWSLIGKKCGTFSKRSITTQMTTDSDIFFTGWFHPHPDNKPPVKPCEDPYPHSGRTIKVTVRAKLWTCVAIYPEGALGTQLPDTSGHSGPAPKPCKARKQPQPA